MKGKEKEGRKERRKERKKEGRREGENVLVFRKRENNYIYIKKKSL